MTVTKKGYELATRLQPISPSTQIKDLALTCSRISKLAATMHRIAEVNCSVQMSSVESDKLDRQDTQCEKNVARHCETLSKELGVTVTPHFNGDPRGPSVKLKLPEAWQHLYDCAGKEGVCVP